MAKKLKEHCLERERERVSYTDLSFIFLEEEMREREGRKTSSKPREMCFPDFVEQNSRSYTWPRDYYVPSINEFIVFSFRVILLI